jgi:hypothetical protein
VQRKTKDNELGLSLVIFVQAFLRRSEEQKKYYLRDLLIYALLYYRTDNIHGLFIYRLCQGLSNMVNTVLFISSKKQ